MEIIVNPNLIFWPGKRLKLAFIENNDNQFIFFEFKENYFNILNQFIKPIKLFDIQDKNQILLIQDLVEKKMLINKEEFLINSIESERWSGFRFLDSYRLKHREPHIEERYLEDNTIFIIDHFFDELEQNSMSYWFSSSNYMLNDIDKDDSQYSKNWVNNLFDIKTNLKYFPLFKEIDNEIKKIYLKKSLELVEVKAYLTNYGSLATYHQDSENVETVTVVIYLHTTWKLDWHGELIICNKNGQPYYSIAPNPGRIVIFDGKLFHRAGEPSRICFEGRKTLVFRYRYK